MAFNNAYFNQKHINWKKTTEALNNFILLNNSAGRWIQQVSFFFSLQFYSYHFLVVLCRHLMVRKDYIAFLIQHNLVHEDWPRCVFFIQFTVSYILNTVLFQVLKILYLADSFHIPSLVFVCKFLTLSVSHFIESPDNLLGPKTSFVQNKPNLEIH